MGYKKVGYFKMKYDIEKKLSNENCDSALEEIYKDDEYIYYLPLIIKVNIKRD